MGDEPIWPGGDGGGSLPPSVVSVSPRPSASGQVPEWNGSAWVPTAVSGGGSGGATVVTGGSLGATPSLTLTGEDTMYSGTLTADTTLTITGLTAGCRAILDITQDSTVRALSVTVGGSTIALPMPATGGAQFLVTSPDGTAAHVSALGSGPASTTVLGTIKLAGDLGGTAASPSVPGLTSKADLVSGLVPISQLASGTPNGTKFIRDDGTLATPSGGGVGSSADEEKPTAAQFESFSRRFAQATMTASSGVLLLSAIWLPVGTVVTAINVLTGATGSGTHGWGALYDNSAAPALLRQSTDDTGVAWTANTVKTFTLTSTFTTTYSGLHYVGFMVVAGTMPTLASDQSSTATANQLPPFLSNSAQGGLTTTAPATATSLGVQTKQFYAYVS